MFIKESSVIVEQIKVYLKLRNHAVLVWKEFLHWYFILYLWFTQVNMECIVHYHYNDVKYSELKSLSENQYERIKAKKNIRTQSTERYQHI